MKINTFTSIALLLCALLFSAAASASQGSGDITSICDTYSAKIKSSYNKGEFIEAIITAAEYDEALMSRYPTPLFDIGLFQSEAHHISFHCPFTAWAQESLETLPELEEIEATGCELLLLLYGENINEMFVVFSVDWGKLMQRLGLEEFGMAEVTDVEMLLVAETFGMAFGTIDDYKFKQIGGHYALDVDFASFGTGPSIKLILLEHDGRFFGFLLTSSLGNRDKNEELLNELITTVDYNYLPPDTAKINLARGKMKDKINIGDILNCVRELATYAEYGAASDELNRLRAIVGDKIPGPEVIGNTGRYDVYGITLENPDSSKWNLYVEQEGGFKALVLEDRFSVNPSGVMISIINTVLAYGPRAVEMLENLSEEEAKMFLSTIGRGGLMSMGGEILSERYRVLKGELAYEGVASTNMANTKVKVILLMKPGYFVMIIMLLDDLRYDSILAELEKILDKNLKIE